MFFKYIILLLITFNIINAKVEVSEPVVVDNTDIGFVNITSDTNSTKIYLDGKYIGDTPIDRYKVDANKNIELKGIADEKFYPKEFIRNINIKKFKTQSYKAKFKKANAKLLLIGPDGYLFVNDRFERTLGSNNRVVKILADDKIKIEIKNGDKKFTILKNMYANNFYQLEYDFKKKKEEELVDDTNATMDIEEIIKKERIYYTVTIDKLIWQDSKEINTNKLEYIATKNYCMDLELAGYTDWKVPTIEQLKNLDKSKFKNKFTDTPYWSSTTTTGKYVYWDYVLTKNFKTNKIVTLNGSQTEANKLCVRDVIED
ncbi:MAG: DUF1566 domain-containing protein [Campylobacterota bacterium]|nr:DUF1566 domain-containing protein [Campylobacterota bacterium]